VNKLFGWLDRFFEQEKKEDEKEGRLKRKYQRVLRTFLILLCLGILIGKINGGEQKVVLNTHGKITSTDNEEIGAQLYQRENLKNGASQLTFELTEKNFDYQKKRLVVTQDKQEIKGEILNRRFFSIQTKPFEKFSALHLKLYTLEGEEETVVLDTKFNLKAIDGKATKFSRLKSENFDQILVNTDLQKISKEKSKKEKEMDQLEKTMELDHQSIRSLEEQEETTTVDSDKKEIRSQIDRYQEAVERLDQKLKTLTDEKKELDQTLAQLQKQEGELHEKE
jgi:hypothetical protein